MDSRSIL
ncbi:hypothetical protein MTR67_048264 [Solanum verrucosum]|nr:hypothetical protein MTR67_048264 [Solanum verrucosum]